MIRIGQGFDVHKFTTRRPCILGGVCVSEEIGLEGHSDADVLTHALMDALLGALNLGDIGHWFPDTDAQYKNISSMKLLSLVCAEIIKKDYHIINLDVTVLAEKPHLAPYRIQIASAIAKALNIEVDCVSVKATTTEKLGFVGREEGIAALAVVLLEKTNEQIIAKPNFKVAQLSPQVLAYIGDAVFEMYVRRYLITLGLTRGSDLQKQAKTYVTAKAQAQRLQGIMAMLTTQEIMVLKRGRNSKKGIIPKNTDAIVYRYSTALEALLGYLYLNGAQERLEELINALIKYEGESHELR